MRTDNAGNARRRAGGDWMTALCAAVFNAIRACAGTMLWMLAVVWSWYLVWPLFALVPLLAAGVVLGVSHVLPDGPRRVVRWLLPVIGDVDRWRVRHARCLGNRWLRDTGLIRDSAGRRAVRYRVFLWSDRLVIDRLPVVGVTGETLRRALAGSLDAWGMADYVLERTGAGSWAATLYPVSRLATLGEPRHVDGLPAAEADSGRLRVLVGRGLDEEVWVDLSETSGLLVAGMPGSGKTQGMLVIAAGLLSLPNHVDLYVSDGKAAGDWSWLSPYCETYTDDLDGTLDMLRRVRELMEERLRRGRDSGHPDFWDGFGRDRVDGGRNGRAVVVVLDEVQTWAMPVTADRADKARAAEFVRLASDIVRRGCAAGVCLIMGTQKPTSDAIPTGLRDMCGLRVAFRCSTPEMAKAALGALPDGEPDPVGIPRSMPGLAVTVDDTGEVSYVRFDLPSRSMIARRLHDSRWYDEWKAAV